MRRLAWVAVLAVLAACTPARAPALRSTPAPDHDTALLRDARECEEDADSQLGNAAQSDPGIRLLYFQACMGLRGWQTE